MNEEEIECAQGKTAEGKLKILVDENILDKNLIKSLEKKFNLKMAVKNRGLDDKNVHIQAITESRVILTNDGHFWDNIKCPMQKTSGIIIIPAKDTDETTIDMVYVGTAMDGGLEQKLKFKKQDILGDISPTMVVFLLTKELNMNYK